MTNSTILETLHKKGLAVVPNVLTPERVQLLREELSRAVSQDSIDYPDVFDSGMVHNCMVRGSAMASLLDEPVLTKYLDVAFSDTCIIYAYQSSSLPPGKNNYGSRIHVDSPRYIDGYATNMGVIFALDDFTLENGATYYLPGSHLKSVLPDEASFYAGAKRACCSAGDMIIFHARLAHAAGSNTTSTYRHALTINFCRSYMRQRFDLPRLVPQKIIDSLGIQGRRLLGMNVRVPTTLAEFYLPNSQRLYQPGQG